jgi:hypothetical protein
MPRQSLYSQPEQPIRAVATGALESHGAFGLANHEEVMVCRLWLDMEIEATRPAAVAALGATATSNWSPISGVSQAGLSDRAFHSRWICNPPATIASDWTVKVLRQNLRIARGFTAMTVTERKAYERRSAVDYRNCLSSADGP